MTPTVTGGPAGRTPSLQTLGTVALAVVTAGLAIIATRGILTATDGVAAVPLDDTYIHFQFARSFAELRPLVYSAGDPAVAGATSLLWPLVLAPFWAMGLKGSLLIWPAWALGWLALFGLAVETWRLSRGLLSEGVAFSAGASVLCFGGLVWCAGSGMEVVPFAWLLLRTARVAAEWFERRSVAATPGAWLGLLALAWLGPCMRPEGLLASLMVCAAVALAPRGRPRALALVALLGPALPALFNALVTGEAASTTSAVKWLPSSPYEQGNRLVASILYNLEVLFGTLLDGRVWSAVFVPTGAKVVAWLALPALCVVAHEKRQGFRGGLVLLVALGMLIPTTYDSFLWNRLRYLWPFAPGWLIALGAMAELFGLLLARLHPAALRARLLLAGGVAGAFASHLSWTLDDLATSAHGILAQQADLGHWAREQLPHDARIGVNDTGAIAYFSERRVFDVVGLTTRGEARYWVAGAGSRFEHYEKLPKAALPSHFIVYPAWLGMPPVLGESLTERTVTGATILGGTTKVAHRADWSALGSAERPLELPLTPKGRLRDRLDVADLESEAVHDYQLFHARQADNRVFHEPFASPKVADGGRARRTLDRFQLDVAAGGALVLRIACESSLSLSLRIQDRTVGKVPCSAREPWEELRVELPSDLVSGRGWIEVTAEAESFAALHYWAYDPEP